MYKLRPDRKGAVEMYTMISEYGNETAYAEDKATKERLLALGFKEVKTEKRTSGKGAGKNEAKNTDRA